jgi:hypothetical protein
MVSLEFFIDNPSGPTMALGLTHPLTEMSTRNISRIFWEVTLPSSCAESLEIWEHQPPGILRACSGLYRGCFAFYILKTHGSLVVNGSDSCINFIQDFD